MKSITKVAAILLLTIGAAACSGDEEPAEDTTPEETPVEEAATPEPEPAAEEAAAPEEAPAGEVAAPGEAAVDGDGAVVAALTDPLEDTLYIELECGRVVIEMLPELAPLHVERIKTLTREGFYDGLTFHRVIDGFMAQTGDPLGTGFGASQLPDLPAEFNNEQFVRGAVGMARGTNPNSANSQFFIMFDRWASLDGQYTLWGHVTEGMECVDQIKRGEPVIDPDIILTMRVAADVQ